MANEIEKKFFDTFGIEPKCVKRTLKLAMPEYNENDLPKDLMQFMSSQTQVYHIYPEITDRILLELICIVHTSPVIAFVSRDVKSLREEVLMVLCNWVNNRNIKQQVQALFEEVENEN